MKSYQYNQHIFSILLLTLITLPVTGCGFQLRGSHHLNHQQVNNHQFQQTLTTPQWVKIQTDDNLTANAVKRSVKKQLNVLGYQTEMTDAIKIEQTPSTININNIRFRRYDLVGVLTEVRLVILADVSYKVWTNGKLTTHTQPLQIERSYQYNEASVSVEDQQGTQIKHWLYQALARRVADQYLILTQE